MESAVEKVNSRKTTAIEKLTIAAMVSAPFTSLRFSFFGISEICLIVVFLYVLIRSRFVIRLEKDNLTKDFFVFVVGCIAGWIFNVLSIDTGTLHSAVYNYAAYLFTLLAIVSCEHLICCWNTGFSPQTILFYFFIWLSVISFILYVISRFSDSLFGFPLLYYSMFRPLSDNIHQLAMAVIPLPFIGLFMAKQSRSWAARIVLALLCVSDVIIVFATGSFKAGAGIILGGIVLAFMLLLTSRKLSKRSRNLILLFFIIVLLVLFIVNLSRIGYYIQRLFTENDVGSSRENLYNQAVRLLLRYPLFGLGPASVITYGTEFFDAHETFFTAGLAAGIFGIVSIVIIVWKCIRVLIRHAFYISAFVPILVYVLGGDILRKTGVWICIVLMYYAVKSDDLAIETKPNAETAEVR